MSLIESDQPYWSRTVSELMGDLGSSPQGISAGEAARRLRQFGVNSVEEHVEYSTLRLLLRQFESPLVLILVFGAIVSLLLQDWVDASIILVIVTGSSLLAFLQEYRASAAVAALRRRLALTVQVYRDGVVHIAAATTIVPGDVVELSAGDLVPADGILISARDFLVIESSLTGESFPVEKHSGVVSPETPLAARTNSVFLGTSVRSGTAMVLVTRTGRTTAFGAVADRLIVRQPESEFARGIRQFGYLLVRVMLVMVVFVLVVNQLLHRPVIESFLFAVALAVGLSPELLPAIISVTLSHGARAMARRGVIVRRLEAIENLGSMDILCTDKTGTITTGVVALDATVDPDGEPSTYVRKLAFLNAAMETGIENPLDAAIVAVGERDNLATTGQEKIDEIPYDFIRKRLTIVVAAEGDRRQHQIITKGAFDNVLDICTTMTGRSGVIPLDLSAREQLDDYYRRKGGEGYRVLALATKHVAAREHYGHEDERSMTFAGFLLFFDPPKAEARKMIARLDDLGIRIKIISGDNRYVAGHIADQIGLDSKAILTGEEIAHLRDESLWHRVEQTDLFVEVDPQQKERIVNALKRTGHAVGYMGDGINDAPALRAADVSISVDQAVDVARESADIILLRPDLNVLCRGVEDGRRTFANTLKYISITISANFGNMVSMALAAPLLPFLPLAAKQILLNNFLSDFPSIAISSDNVDTPHIVRAQRWSMRDVQHFMITFGLVSTCFDLLTFLLLLSFFKTDETTFQTAWFVVSLLTELAVVLVLRTEGAALRSAPSHLLLLITSGVGIVAIVIPYIHWFADTFDFVPLSWHILVSMMMVVALYVASTEFVKLKFFRRKHLQNVQSCKRTIDAHQFTISGHT